MAEPVEAPLSLPKRRRTPASLERMFVVGGIVVAVIFGLLAAFPQIWWRISSGWAYRNPDAVEPSDAYYAIQRIVAGILAVIALVVGIALQVNTAAQADRARECSEVEKLSDGVAVDDRSALIERLEKRGYSVEEDDVSSDIQQVTVSRGSDEVASLTWGGSSDGPLFSCSS